MQREKLSKQSYKAFALRSSVGRVSIMKNIMKDKKLWYVITCHHKHVQLGSENTFLVRMVDDFQNAKKLMQSIYDDAKEERVAKFGGKYSNPKWLDDKHLRLEVTHDININGWLHSTTTEVYELSDEWDFNVFDNKPWILD